MSQFLELQIDIMLVLWVRSHGSNNGYSRDGLFRAEQRSNNSKIGPVSRKRVDAALDELIGRGHACEDDLDENAEVLFVITKKGIYWLEDWYRVEKTNDGFSFHRRREGPIYVDLTYAQAAKKNEKITDSTNDPPKDASADPHFWSKWGAILTGFSILVAIVLAALF